MSPPCYVVAVRRTLWLNVDEVPAGGVAGLTFARHAAVGVREAMPAPRARSLARAVLDAEADLGDDFGGEQRSLGRPWYTHMETGRAAEYFRDARASDARVERVVPGVQDEMLRWLARLLGGVVRRRHGFCGPGVHVFPPGEKVARRGGVFHYDLEGLTPAWRHTLPPAISAVWMLQPAHKRGGLTLFNKRFVGENWPMDEDPDVRRTTTLSRAGDLLVFSSYRLHRINGFSGDDARVSATCHAVMVDDGVWEAWF